MILNLMLYKMRVEFLRFLRVSTDRRMEKKRKYSIVRACEALKIIDKSSAHISSNRRMRKEEDVVH